MDMLTSPLAIFLYSMCALGLIWLTARTVRSVISGDDPIFQDSESGYEIDARIGHSRKNANRTVVLSDRVKSLALANSKIEACKALMEESGIGLAEAKTAIEDFQTDPH